VTVALFGDHHAYTAGDRARIVREAAGRAIVTTEKDATKLHALLPGTRLWALRQVVEIETGADTLAESLDRIGK
jgi:tetraacyldisaccharide-1-P 4'-kinase